MGLVLVVQAILTWTRWGLWTFATGGNLVGAAESGVNVRRIKIGNFVLANFLAGFAGILDSTRITTIVPLQGGPDLMFLAVAGAVIGGTSLFGGVGTVIGSFIGVAGPDHPPHRPEHHRRQRLHVRPDHRPRDPAVDDRERPGRPAAQPREAAVSEAATQPDAIRVEHISKSFGVVTALVDVSMHLAKGEVLGLVGDNGAGKSTLIKILTGFMRPDAGTIFVNGEEVVIRSVDHARSLGIDTVYQDLALVPSLSVAHNMFLKRELTHGIGPIRWLDNREMRKRARKYIEDIGIGTLRSVNSEVAMLSGGQRQAIAIARSVHSGATTLLLDEPLAAMGAREGRLILDLIRELKERGDVSMIVIAHNYVQVFEVADRVNLIRNGTITFDRPTSETSVEELTEIVAAEYRARG